MGPEVAATFRLSASRVRKRGCLGVGRRGCAGARDHYRDESDGLERGEAFPEGEEADDGRDCRVDAVDDGDDPRLEAAETLEFERERDDQTTDSDHEPDGERSRVDRACMSDP